MWMGFLKKINKNKKMKKRKNEFWIL